MPVSEVSRDPVHGARYRFERRGDDLVVECWLEPGGALPPHLHPAQEERWSVLDGEVRMRLGRSTRAVGPADGEQVVAAGVKHGLANRSGREARLSCYVSPARGLESFLTGSAEAARRGLFRKGGIPTGPRGLRWAADFLAEHSDDVVMSFPPPPVVRAMIALFASDEAKRRMRAAGAEPATRGA